MSFNAIRENKILAKISEFTVFNSGCLCETKSDSLLDQKNIIMISNGVTVHDFTFSRHD